ncbi:dihydrofolate reductase family protein [Amphibacillus sp. Q70]|uniref:dihydrofolate reductase family protein n=1 Tax=Amphibacillus sp. Q70 TaxID=3453416 RepID=UPI003F82790E
MQKPYVIIHTHTSLDGKIHAIDLPEFKAGSQQYQELALYPDKQVFNIQGYINGRVTTDDNTTFYRKPELNEQADPVPEGDFIADDNAPMYYISLDPSGRLGWEKNVVDYGNIDSHVIEVLTERVSNAYKDFLRRMNISYIIAGKDQLDNALVLHKLATVFKMKNVMIGGGGTVNWSYIDSGLVDEVSIVMAPIADGSDEQSLFNAKEPFSKEKPVSFTLIDAKPLKESTVWLRYKVNKGKDN